MIEPQASREMTLQEYIEVLPDVHRARKEYDQLLEQANKVVRRAAYVYLKAGEMQLSMPRQKLVRMEMSDLEDLRKLGAAISEMGIAIDIWTAFREGGGK